jgi:hypothetical protein
VKQYRCGLLRVLRSVACVAYVSRAPCRAAPCPVLQEGGVNPSFSKACLGAVGLEGGCELKTTPRGGKIRGFFVKWGPRKWGPRFWNKPRSVIKLGSCCAGNLGVVRLLAARLVRRRVLDGTEVVALVRGRRKQSKQCQGG